MQSMPLATNNGDAGALLGARRVQGIIANALREVCSCVGLTPRCRSQFGRVGLYFKNNVYASLAFAVDFLLYLRRKMEHILHKIETLSASDFWLAVSNSFRSSASVVKKGNPESSTYLLLLDVALQISCKNHDNALPISGDDLQVIKDILSSCMTTPPQNETIEPEQIIETTPPQIVTVRDLTQEGPAGFDAKGQNNEFAHLEAARLTLVAPPKKKKQKLTTIPIQNS
jgi:hypothetical protein